MAAQALTAPNAPGPDRLTTTATGAGSGSRPTAPPSVVGDARSLAAPVPPVAGAAEQHHAEEQPCQAVLADPSHVSYETRPAGSRATWRVPMVLP